MLMVLLHLNGNNCGTASKYLCFAIAATTHRLCVCYIDPVALDKFLPIGIVYGGL